MKQIVLTLGLLLAMNLSAQDIQLPKPVTTGGMPLMEALANRSTHRDISDAELDNQTLSNLLWAAWGFNREDKRTAPSSQNKQVISLYVVLKDAAYLYDAKENILRHVISGDIRKEVGKQDFVYTAPVNLVFVEDVTKKGAAQFDCGYISQNIYLYCTSANLATVVRGYFDPEVTHKALKLAENQKAVLTQTVGKVK